MGFEIVTDSSCNLLEDMIDDFGLHILPLTFMIDGEQYQSYLKGERTDLKQFYTMMREGKVITTSLPNLKDSRELLEGFLPRARMCSTSGSPAGFPAPTRPSTFCWPSWPTPTRAARCSRWTPWPPPWAKGCSSGTPPRCARRVRPSPRFATGWRPTSCTWPTGSPWTT